MGTTELLFRLPLSLSLKLYLKSDDHICSCSATNLSTANWSALTPSEASRNLFASIRGPLAHHASPIAAAPLAQSTE